MKKENLMFYEKIILDKLEKANVELARITDEMENDEGDSSSDYARLINHQSKYIASLKNALVRIKNGTFGICEETGEEISPDRLKLVPNSNMSVFAKSVHNKDKK